MTQISNLDNVHDLCGILSKIWPGYNRKILVPTLENIKWVLKLHGEVTNVNQMVHFLAQTGHETDGYRTLKEYGDNKYFERYKNHKSLTIWEDNIPKWIGRGHIQITGRVNYMLVQGELGHDYPILEDPKLLEDPKISLIASVHWWRIKRCNVLADADDVTALTRRINGGTNGLQQRINYYNYLKLVFKNFVW